MTTCPSEVILDVDGNSGSGSAEGSSPKLNDGTAAEELGAETGLAAGAETGLAAGAETGLSSRTTGTGAEAMTGICR